MMSSPMTSDSSADIFLFCLLFEWPPGVISCTCHLLQDMPFGSLQPSNMQEYPTFFFVWRVLVVQLLLELLFIIGLLVSGLIVAWLLARLLVQLLVVWLLQFHAVAQREQLHQHMTELIVVYKIVAADSSEPKCSDNNSESSDALPAIGPPQALWRWELQII